MFFGSTTAEASPWFNFDCDVIHGDSNGNAEVKGVKERSLPRDVFRRSTMHGSRNLRAVVITGALLRALLTISAMPLAVFEIGCSQSQFPHAETTNSTQSTTQSALSVTIEPQSLGIRPGDSWNFIAIVSGSGSGVNWSIQEGSVGGDVNYAGNYTAPATGGVYHVIATSKADPSKSATATVSVEKTGFTLTGSLKTPRLAHTATLLPNGLVYVAGGDSADDYEEVDAIADQAELFNPATGAFQPGEKVMREFHTATLLQNGDVLFTGGISETESPTATAELLKAGSTSLQPTGNMSVGRSFHTATLLLDGRVLITGGWGGPSGLTQTAEVYDPVSGTFTPAGNMGRARFHSATLLLTGKVLITGYGSDAELFDPATNSFTPAGSFTTSGDTSYVYAATLLADGRVLVTNGPDAPSQIYDPTTGQFTPTGTMATWRAEYTATLLSDGTVLIAGGYTNPSTPGTGVVPVASTEIYNPSTGVFDPGPTMRQGRYHHTATRLPDGSVLFVGGTGGTTLASAEIYH